MSGPVSLRTHSWFSLLEGMSSPTVLLERAARLGYRTIALTDVNNLYGAVRFVEVAGQLGIRPIVGCCLRKGDQRATALVAEPSGYGNLCLILHQINTQKVYRFDRDLPRHSAGLHLLIDDPALLKAPLLDAFKGRVWLEVVRPGQSETREKTLLETGKQCGLRPVASLNCRFAEPSGVALFRLAVAIRQQGTLAKVPPRMPIRSEHHLAPPEELQARYRTGRALPEAVLNAERLAEELCADVIPRRRIPPPVAVPNGHDAASYLRQICERELARYQWTHEPTVRRRLEEEIAALASLDFAGHALLLAELAAEARRQKWPLTLRGSGGASLVCYLLGLGQADPIRHGLRYERFANPGRLSPPDLDVDLAKNTLPGVRGWLFQKYKDEHVALVGQLKTFQAASALRDAALAHGVPRDQIKALMEAIEGSKDDLPAEDFGQLALAPPAWPLPPEQWPRFLADARALINMPHLWEAHRSGLVLSAAPIAGVIPLQSGPGGSNLAQLDKDAIEKVGLVKLDLLSSRELSAQEESRAVIRLVDGGEGLVSSEEGDPATLRLLAQGETVGIDQVETPLLRRLLRQVCPKNAGDLIQTVAIARPAVGKGGGRESYLRRRHGLEPVQYHHADLEPVLRETWGLLLYEDDCLGVIEALTGWPAAEADRLRRELANKDTADSAAARFVDAAQRNTVPKPIGEAVCEQLSRWQAYGFCKAHATNYGLMAWNACRLKARHPLAFWMGSLNNHKGEYLPRVQIEAAKRSNLLILPPCVNRSGEDFTEEVHAIRTGLGAIRCLAEKGPKLIVDERSAGGRISSLADFRARVSPTDEDLALLIRAGALDFTGKGRRVLLQEAGVSRLGQLPAWWVARHEPEPFPLDTLLGDSPLLWQWRGEWDLLGWVCGQPLMSLARRGLPHGLTDSRSLPDLTGKKVRLAGLVASEKSFGDGDSDPLRHLVLEDEFGMVEVTVPAGRGVADLASLGPVVLVEGTVEERYGVPLIVASKLEKPLPGGGQGSGGNKQSADTGQQQNRLAASSSKSTPANGVKVNN